MEKIIHHVAQNVEKQLDNEIERLDALDSSDLEAIRQQRLNEMKQRAAKKQQWLANGHGEYTELDGEKEFFTACNKSENLVCHFYRNDAPRCRIVDMHLKTLAARHVETRFVRLDAERAPFLTADLKQLAAGHVETRFVKLDVERAPFLTERLKIRVLPTLALVKDNKTRDFVVGFTDLGNRDDFATEMLEWRIARADVIEYSGDLLAPPPTRKPRVAARAGNTIRSAQDDSDSDLSD